MNSQKNNNEYKFIQSSFESYCNYNFMGNAYKHQYDSYQSLF